MSKLETLNNNFGITKSIKTGDQHWYDAETVDQARRENYWSGVVLGHLGAWFGIWMAGAIPTINLPKFPSPNDQDCGLLSRSDAIDWCKEEPRLAIKMQEMLKDGTFSFNEKDELMVQRDLYKLDDIQEANLERIKFEFKESKPVKTGILHREVKE